MSREQLENIFATSPTPKRSPRLAPICKKPTGKKPTFVPKPKISTPKNHSLLQDQKSIHLMATNQRRFQAHLMITTLSTKVKVLNMFQWDNISKKLDHIYAI